MTAITDRNLQKKMNEKTFELKKTIELIKQNPYEKKNKKYNTESIYFGKRKTHNEKRTNTRTGKIRHETKKYTVKNQTRQILQCTELDTRHLRQTATNVGRKVTTQKHVDKNSRTTEK